MSITSFPCFKYVFGAVVYAAVCQSSTFAAIEIYSEDFNGLNGGSSYVSASSSLGSEWSFYSTNQGRSQVYNWGASRGGVLVLDDWKGDSTYSLNEAILSVDLGLYDNVVLSFEQYDSYDEEHPIGTSSFTGHRNADGVSISSDGINWFPIINFNQYNNSWKTYTVNLTSAVDSINSSLLNLNGTLMINFQQYDNYPHGDDGRKFDNIVICGEEYPQLHITPEPQSAALFLFGVVGSCLFVVRSKLNPNLSFLKQQ